jgi:glycosyltransferase involved in cell wall biosynthesis
MTGRRELPPLPDTPLVSVIIPCYNQAHFLPETIESALRQTYPRRELVVVDDGSSDDTWRVAASYSEVRYVRQDNQGVVRARNRGLAGSGGECVVFLDADDRLRPRALEAGLAALRRCPGAAFSYGWCDLIAADGSFLVPSPRLSVEGDHYVPLLRANFMPNPAGLMFRREPLEATGGFQVGVEGVEDYELCLRLARLYGACACREVVADYRQHGASLSRRAALMSNSMLRVLQSQATLVSGDRARERALRQGLARWRRVYYAESLVARARENAQAGRWRPAFRDALALLRANPRLLLQNAARKLALAIRKMRPT